MFIARSGEIKVLAFLLKRMKRTVKIESIVDQINAKEI